MYSVRSMQIYAPARARGFMFSSCPLKLAQWNLIVTVLVLTLHSGTFSKAVYVCFYWTSPLTYLSMLLTSYKTLNLVCPYPDVLWPARPISAATRGSCRRSPATIVAKGVSDDLQLRLQVQQKDMAVSVRVDLGDWVIFALLEINLYRDELYRFEYSVNENYLASQPLLCFPVSFSQLSGDGADGADPQGSRTSPYHPP